MNHHLVHGVGLWVNWVALFTLKLHCSSTHKCRSAFTTCLPPAVFLKCWGASRKMLAVSSITMDVINGCSVFYGRLLQELPAWKTVHLKTSEQLFVGAFSQTHTHEIQRNKKTYLYLWDRYFSAVKGVATTFIHLWFFSVTFHYAPSQLQEKRKNMGSFMKDIALFYLG